uniref:Uncharacterized protein n=1 Tax=Thermocrispum agreste TaxID=37925 RepID=A0A2W4JMB3_9PSEU|nr:MAG: hypothetical protein DIU77_05440 [Thermocrispum agreste]
MTRGSHVNQACPRLVRLALALRVEPRDFPDVDVARATGRYTREQLLDLAEQTTLCVQCQASLRGQRPCRVARWRHHGCSLNRTSARSRRLY